MSDIPTLTMVDLYEGFGDDILLAIVPPTSDMWQMRQWAVVTGSRRESHLRLYIDKPTYVNGQWKGIPSPVTLGGCDYDELCDRLGIDEKKQVYLVMSGDPNAIYEHALFKFDPTIYDKE